MPRSMPRYDLELAKEGKKALGLASAGEIVRAHSGAGTIPWNEWSINRLEALYELAFLRAFVAWEMFLVTSFYRYACCYVSRHGQATPVVRHFPNLSAVEAAVLGPRRQFVHWYQPSHVITRCQQHVQNGFHEIVLNSHISRLEHFAAIR